MDDLNDPDITFDINGQCNYCAEFDEKKIIYFETEDEQKNLRNLKIRFNKIIPIRNMM